MFSNRKLESLSRRRRLDKLMPLDYYHSLEDLNFIKETYGMVYLGTAKPHLHYDPSWRRRDMDLDPLIKSAFRTVPPSLAPALREAKSNWKRGQLLPNISYQNVALFPSRKAKMPLALRALLIDIASEVKSNIFATPCGLITPLTTGAAIQHPRLTTNTTPSLYVRRAKHKYPVMREWQHRGDYEKFRRLKPRKRRDQFGNLVISTKAEAYSTYIETFHSDGLNFHELVLPPCTTGFRFQVSQSWKNKARTMLIPADNLILEEARYVLPLMEAIAECGTRLFTFAAHIETAVSNRILELLKDVGVFQDVYSVDYSAWDSSVPAYLLLLGFEILYSLFHHDQVLAVDSQVYPVSADKSRLRWMKMVQYIIFTPIQLPAHTVTGKCYVVMKAGGIPSGAMMTNIIGSIVNAIVTVFICRTLTGGCPRYLKVQGDDTLLFTQTKLDMDKYAEIARRLGLTVSVEKSRILSRDGTIDYLGHTFDRASVYRPPVKVYASLLYPERAVLHPDDVFERLLGLISAQHLLANDGVLEHLIAILHELKGLYKYDQSDIESLSYNLVLCRYFYKMHWPKMYTTYDEWYKAKADMICTHQNDCMYAFKPCIFEHAPLDDIINPPTLGP